MKKKYRVGIIGAGLIASGYDNPKSENILTHAHAIKLSHDFLLSGFYDVSRNNRINASSKWDTNEYESVQTLIDDSDIICCAVPDSVHYEVLKELYDSDHLKAVICEKPIATNVCDAEELVSKFSIMNTILLVNYSRRFMDSFRRLKDEIDDFGRLIVGNCFYGKGLFHNCSHMINILDYLLDLSDYKIERAICSVNDYEEDDSSVEFYMNNNESRIFFHVIPCRITSVFQFDLCFEKGRIIYDDANEELRYFDIKKSDKFEGYTNYSLAKRRCAERNEALPCLYKDVAKIIEGKGINHSDGYSAIETLKKCFEVSELGGY